MYVCSFIKHTYTHTYILKQGLCMYVCVNVCMHVCMHACMYSMHMYVCVFTSGGREIRRASSSVPPSSWRPAAPPPPPQCPPLGLVLAFSVLAGGGQVVTPTQPQVVVRERWRLRAEGVSWAALAASCLLLLLSCRVAVERFSAAPCGQTSHLGKLRSYKKKNKKTKKQQGGGGRWRGNETDVDE